MNRYKPEEMDTKEFGKMSKRILMLEGSCQECERIENRKAKKDIQENFSLICYCKTICCYRMASPSTSTTSGTAARCTPLFKVD